MVGHREASFPAALFTDTCPSLGGRLGTPPQAPAAMLPLQTLYGAARTGAGPLATPLTLAQHPVGRRMDGRPWSGVEVNGGRYRRTPYTTSVDST
ncbi:hypothetical protein GCM10009525_39110 [Streptosporangium amethystogenes subsp. fukuiense]